jgi:cell division transport system permease protein
MRFLKLAIQNFFRNFWLSITSIIIMLLMLFCLSLLYNFNVIGQQIMVSLKDKMDLGVYLNQNIDQNKTALLISELENMKEIKKLDFFSPEQSLENFKDKHQNDSLILRSLETLNENPFGGLITIKFHNPTDYQKIISVIEKPVYQSLIQEQNFYDYQNLIHDFNAINQKITQAGISISVLFSLITVLVIFTTIKLGALSRQKEIKIMRLVGASAHAIRRPFLIEGGLYAGISWILNMGIIFSLAYFFQPRLQQFLELNFNLFNYLKNAFYFWVGLLAFSLVISLIGSGLAIKKYLKL